MKSVNIDGIELKLRQIESERTSKDEGKVEYMGYDVPIYFFEPRGDEVTPAIINSIWWREFSFTAGGVVRYRKVEDIRLLNSIPEDYIPPVLMHEFAEFETQSHDFARKAADAYAKEFLPNERYKSFCQWTEQWERKV